jgi:4'-phosphopantetheinyl transferase
MTIEVWVIALDQPQAAVIALWSLLDPAERERASRLRTPELTRRFVVAHGALRRLLAGALGCRPEAVVFTADENGKPHLPGQGLHFNLSHAGELALLAVSAAGPLGVDVEPVRALPDRDLVADRFFSPHERRALAAAADRDRAFFTLWTRKEAYLKALGYGLARPLAEFDVSLDEPARLLADRAQPAAVETWELFHLTPAPGYLGAVCAPAACGPVRVASAPGLASATG